MNSQRILIVGSSNFDLTIYCDRLPGPGETVLGGRFASGIGGKGANQATAARRMGGDVTFFSAIGTDAHGETIRKHFERENVRCHWAEVPGDTATGAALILVDQAGRNSIAVAPGANAALLPETVETIRFADFGHMLISLEIPLETATRAAVLAKQAGCRVLLNPAPAALLPEALLRNTDFLLPNEHEVFLLQSPRPASHEESAARLCAAGVGSLIVTLGENGAKAMAPGKTLHVPGFPSSPVDTVGAGDCFCGTLVACLAEGFPLPEAIATANNAAALSVRSPGAIASFPYRKDILPPDSVKP